MFKSEDKISLTVKIARAKTVLQFLSCRHHWIVQDYTGRQRKIQEYLESGRILHFIMNTPDAGV